MDMDLVRIDYTVIGLTNSQCMELIAGNSPKDMNKVGYITYKLSILFIIL